MNPINRQIDLAKVFDQQHVTLVARGNCRGVYKYVAYSGYKVYITVRKTFAPPRCDEEDYYGQYTHAISLKNCEMC